MADNPAKDFLAPRGLGWLSVQWLRRGQVHSRDPAPSGGKAQVVVHSAKELLGAIADRQTGEQRPGGRRIARRIHGIEEFQGLPAGSSRGSDVRGQGLEQRGGLGERRHQEAGG